MIGRRRRAALALLAATGMGACNLLGPLSSAAPAPTKPQARPQVTDPAVVEAPPPVSSSSLAQYYARLQADLLVQGLLRRDGGGIDTPFDATVVARNFERIALTNEYVRGAGLVAADGEPGPVQKWVAPVRVRAEFGTSVPAAMRAKDSESLSRYVSRLARITGHPILMAPRDANFHVLFMADADRAQALRRIQQIVPQVDRATLRLIETLPRSIHCLVVAFADASNPVAYGQAIALIRAEHPDLLRLSCIHEEIAQGLGLANDSPFARPSIFNDDDEFALLTSHDEILLKILYDPSLPPGLSAEAARPIVQSIATRLVGGPS